MPSLKSLYKFFSKRFQTVHLEYFVDPKPRNNQGTRTFDLLYKIIDQNRDQYKTLLTSFLNNKSEIQSITMENSDPNSSDPHWNNGFLPGLDIIGIYGMIAHYKPKQFVEIGSGNSTKVARKCITDKGLSTHITSIDPWPRASIDHLSDTVIRSAAENVSDLSLITDKLEKGDILFIDNSHRVLPNSDALVCFMDIMPFLKPGVIVHIHDIYLPYDYPQFMCDRFYNEQYFLAAFMIANPEYFKVLLPNYFISEDKELSAHISEIWNHENLLGVEKHGGSFWVEMGG